jgi:hypothetical protein
MVFPVMWACHPVIMVQAQLLHGKVSQTAANNKKMSLGFLTASSFRETSLIPSAIVIPLIGEQTWLTSWDRLAD